MAIYNGMPAAGVRAEINALIPQYVILRESETPNLSNFTTSGVVVATGTVNTNILTVPSPNLIGKCLFVEAITFGLSALGIAQVQIISDASDRFPDFTYQDMVGPGSITIPVNRVIRAFEVATGGVSLNVRNNTTGGSVTYLGGAAVHGHIITDDLNYNAPYSILFVGDSTINGTGPTKTATMYPFLVRDNLRDLGYNSRVILKSRSGSNSSDHEIWRAGGWHDVANCHMGVYNVGINDAATGMAAGDISTPGTHVYNLNKFWLGFSKRYPGKPLVIVGATPMTNNTYEATAVTHRAAASAYVAGIASPLLRYVDPTALWDRANTALYSAGDGLHYLDAGHALVAGLINAAGVTPVI